MMESLTLDELARAIGGVPATVPARGASVRRVRIFADDIVPGDLFWALAREPVVAARHTALAESRGALAALVSPAVAYAARRRIVVADPRAALLRLAGWYRDLLDAFIIGVSGGNQATAVCNFARAAFGIHPPAGSQHRDPMVALAIALLDHSANDRFAVVNMTGRSDLERQTLANIARPDVMIFAGGGANASRVSAALFDLLPPGGMAVSASDLAAAQGRGYVTCQMRQPNHRAPWAGNGNGAIERSHRIAGENFYFATEIIATERLHVQLDQSRFEIVASERGVGMLAAMAVIAARRLGRRDEEIAKDLARFGHLPMWAPLAA